MGRTRTLGLETEEVKVDLTPLVDVSFQLIAFFIMVTTLASDESAQKVRLPSSPSAPILKDDNLSDAVNINIAYLDPNDGEVRRPIVLGWWGNTELTSDAGWKEFDDKIKLVATLQKNRQGPTWKEKGLSTTVVVRVDGEVDYAVFHRIVESCRKVGFRVFRLKAAEK